MLLQSKKQVCGKKGFSCSAFTAGNGNPHEYVVFMMPVLVPFIVLVPFTVPGSFILDYIWADSNYTVNVSQTVALAFRAQLLMVVFMCVAMVVIFQMIVAIAVIMTFAMCVAFAAIVFFPVITIVFIKHKFS